MLELDSDPTVYSLAMVRVEFRSGTVSAPRSRADSMTRDLHGSGVHSGTSTPGGAAHLAHTHSLPLLPQNVWLLDHDPSGSGGGGGAGPGAYGGVGAWGEVGPLGPQLHVFQVNQRPVGDGHRDPGAAPGGPHGGPTGRHPHSPGHFSAPDVGAVMGGHSGASGSAPRGALSTPLLFPFSSLPHTSTETACFCVCIVSVTLCVHACPYVMRFPIHLCLAVLPFRCGRPWSRMFADRGGPHGSGGRRDRDHGGDGGDSDGYSSGSDYGGSDGWGGPSRVGTDRDGSGNGGHGSPFPGSTVSAAGRLGVSSRGHTSSGPSSGLLPGSMRGGTAPGSATWGPSSLAMSVSGVGGATGTPAAPPPPPPSLPASPFRYPGAGPSHAQGSGMSHPGSPLVSPATGDRVSEVVKTQAGSKHMQVLLGAPTHPPSLASSPHCSLSCLRACAGADGWVVTSLSTACAWCCCCVS
jgi:hypothetical protein